MRVLAVTHGPDVRAELFGEVIRADGHELVEWEISGGGRADVDMDAVIVFGGHQNVGEEERFPWLESEYGLLRSWVRDEIPLLGICLGAQTLAHACGAWVGPAPARQAGFLDVELTEAGRADPVLGVFPPRFEAFVGNGYAFAVPDGAVELATSVPQSQAYRVGARAWAVQFHPEIHGAQALRWWDDDPDPPRPVVEIARELDGKLDAWQALGSAMCRAFLAEAARG